MAGQGQEMRSAREPMLDSAARQNGEASPGAAEEEVVPPASFCALFKYASQRDKILLAFAAVGAVVQGATAPALGFFMGSLFQSIFYPNDDGTVPPTPHAHTRRDHEVNKVCLLFLALACLAFCASSLGFLGFARVADNMAFNLRRRFFDQLLKKDVGWYDTHSAASMSTRLTNDTYEFRQGTGEKLTNLITGMTMSPVGFIAAFAQDWRLTLMMLGVVPIMGGGFGLAIRQLQTAAAKQQAFYTNAGAVAETSISSIRTVASFGGYAREIDKYNTQLLAAESNGRKSGWCNGFSMGFLQVAIWGTFAFGLFVGSFFVIHDLQADCWRSDPPFGTCFTGAKLLSTVWSVLYGGIGLGQVAPALAVLTSAKAAAGRIYAVIEEPPMFEATTGMSPDSAQGTIEFDDVVFTYPTRPDVPALNHASFIVPAGKTAAFVGPSGSGKSTTIALLQRFYDVKSGRVRFDGHDIRVLNLNWLRSKMSMVQQEPVLFSGTVLENIACGAEGATSQDVETAARSANAHSFIRGFARAYQTEVGERGVMLSGGQKQRIAIARAIVRNPAVLLLDEATSALDTESERVVQEALDTLMTQQARTTLVVAHRLSTIRNADQIFVMENGVIRERGTHSELIQAEGSLYAQLTELQGVTGGEAEASQEFTRALSNGSQGGLERAASSEREEKPKLPDVPAEDDVPVRVPTMRLWALQRGEWLVLASAVFCTIPVALGRPIIGLFFAQASNRFSRPPAMLDPATGEWVSAVDVQQLRRTTNETCLEFFLTALALGVVTALQMGLFRSAGEALTRQVRLMTFKAMLRQEVAWFDQRTSGHLAARLASEAPLIKSFTGESLAAMLTLMVTIVGGLAIALWSSWQLTLSSLVLVPLMTIGNSRMMKSFRETNQTKAGPLVSEAMGNIRTVAAFGLHDKMMERYEALLIEEAKEDRKKSRVTGLSSAYASGVQFVIFGGIVFIASVFINMGWIKPESMLSVLFPMFFAASGTAQASQWTADKVKAQTAINHIFHTLDRTPVIDAYDESGDRLESVRGEIEFRHVAFSYPSRRDVPIFTDFDLKIEPGTTVAFCGPSGSGKSSTMALLQRFYVVDSGSICLDGRDIASLHLGWLRQQMALVQQEPVLFRGTVLENIGYGYDGAAPQELVEEAARSANAESFIRSLPEGYLTEVGERGAQLSGGQKQRIAIARAMIRNPPVLLLDEATSALDSESERVVQEALDQLLQQSHRTTLVIAHRLSTIVNSDVICVIYQGQIVEKGRHEELMRIPGGQYKKLAERQHADQLKA